MRASLAARGPVGTRVIEGGAAPSPARSGARSRSVDVLIQIPFRSEIMELPLVGLTVLFSLAAMVVLGRWWER